MARHLTSEGNLVTEEYNHDWTAELVRLRPKRTKGIHSAFLSTHRTTRAVRASGEPCPSCGLAPKASFFARRKIVFHAGNCLERAQCGTL